MSIRTTEHGAWPIAGAVYLMIVMGAALASVHRWRRLCGADTAADVLSSVRIDGELDGRRLLAVWRYDQETVAESTETFSVADRAVATNSSSRSTLRRCGRGVTVELTSSACARHRQRRFAAVGLGFAGFKDLTAVPPSRPDFAPVQRCRNDDARPPTFSMHPSWRGRKTTDEK